MRTIRPKRSRKKSLVLLRARRPEELFLRGGSVHVTRCSYAYDALGRPYSRDTAYPQKEEAEEITYAANELNQYTQIDTNGTVPLRQRYLYRGYLQIAAIDLQRAAQPVLWYITWDSTQTIATRPLALQKDGTWYTYKTPDGCKGGWTCAKHAPRRDETTSECRRINYLYYNPQDGRWTRRDPLEYSEGFNLYILLNNNLMDSNDHLGLCSCEGCKGECARHCSGAERCRIDSKGWCQRSTKTPNGKKPQANGCGSASWSPSSLGFLKIATIIIAGIDFTPACNRHDDCYGTCGASKTYCDVKFLIDLRVTRSGFLISSNRWGYILEYIVGSLNTVCSAVADLYLAAVFIGGGSAIIFSIK